MRKGLASLIIGLSLLVASASWAGFTLSRTLLDPGRSERLADQLLDNPEVRDALVSRLADALEAQIPDEVPVSRQVVERGAELALDDPQVDALVRDGFVKVHQNALAGVSEPVVVDAGALGAAGRRALVEARPELNPFLPAAPSVEVELPTAGLAWLGTVKQAVDQFTRIAALIALVGAVTAFAVARDRGQVLRRVAFWGYGASAFWLLLGYGMPRLASVLSPTSGAIASAAADVFFGAMIRPAIIMAVVATALLVLGMVLPALQQNRGARRLQPKVRRTPATTGTAAGLVAKATNRTSAPPSPRPSAGANPGPGHHSPAVASPIPPGGSRPSVAKPGAAPSPPREPAPAPRLEPWAPVGSSDRTEVMGAPLLPADDGDDPGQDPTTGANRAPQPQPRWREGEGYLDDPPSRPDLTSR